MSPLFLFSDVKYQREAHTVNRRRQHNCYDTFYAEKVNKKDTV
jgi:hypothetical protein